MKVTDAMPFKEFWFEEGDEYLHLPSWMIRLVMSYNFDWSASAEEQENEMFQFLINSGHIWNYSARWQRKLQELIKAGRVQFYTEAHNH